MVQFNTRVDGGNVALRVESDGGMQAAIGLFRGDVLRRAAQPFVMLKPVMSASTLWVNRIP